MDSPGLRQLKQRIAFRCRLNALSPEQTRAYIEHRLRIAGADWHAAQLFSESTMAAVAEYSRGIPRLINTLCENALIEGYARQSHVITVEMIAQVAAESRLESTQPCNLVSDSFDHNAVVDDLFTTVETPAPHAARKTAG